MTQFCIEEAVMERLNALQQVPLVDEVEPLSPHEQALAEHRALINKVRAGA